jgi:hypothetical protein
MVSNTTTQDGRSWWLRTLVVLASPRPVFAALRDDSDDAAAARQEPIAAIVFLAGIAGVLMTTIAGRLMDDPEYDALLIVVWAIVAGAIHGIAAYFVVGALVLLGSSLAGSLGSYRRARHVLAFAAVPLVASLLAIWPVRVALFGEDAFRTGGADAGTGNTVFDAIEFGFLGWTLALLGIGVRTVHGWTWPRSLAATAVPAIAPVLAVARAYGVI